jgi:sulfide dehydrogenase [flavocytochrome c] flavoprotein subunit
MQHKLKTLPNRRRWLLTAMATLGAGLVPVLGHTDDDNDAGSSGSGSTTVTAATTGLSARIVVVGGGMAGATVAKYLRLWGGSGIAVTLVEPNASYTSNIMSNLVLNGSRNVASLAYTYATLSSKYGVTLKHAALQSIDKASKSVTLSDGSVLAFDRLILAPGIEFDNAYGLSQSHYDSQTPHAWHAGAQTTLLASQIAGMADGGVFVMTIPKAPYRCPPGPYERACLVADFLKTRFGSGTNARVIVLDENASIQAEVDNFSYAFGTLHKGVIDYRPGVSGITINPDTRRLTYQDGLQTTQTIQAQVINPIAPQRARGAGTGGWLHNAGLNNSLDASGKPDGRWCVVNVLSYESTAAPGIHVIGDAASCAMPKAGHVANQEAKICADAIIRLLGGQQPDPAPVANSACYSPITASTASWLSTVYQYDGVNRKMVVAANGGNTVGAKATEAATISSANFRQMNTWFSTLMGDSFA